MCEPGNVVPTGVYNLKFFLIFLYLGFKTFYIQYTLYLDNQIVLWGFFSGTKNIITLLQYYYIVFCIRAIIDSRYAEAFP